jgi:hypothetical protein
MRRILSFLALSALVLGCSTAPSEQTVAEEQFPDHPDFMPAPEQGPMPDPVLVVKRTEIRRAKYPVIDFHFHGRQMQTPEEYAEMVEVMD